MKKFANKRDFFLKKANINKGTGRIIKQITHLGEMEVIMAAKKKKATKKKATKKKATKKKKKR
jgi:hypothetical protein